MSAAYCPRHLVHGRYHGTDGFPSGDESVLFERLALEINQAGLSWLTILNKRASFHAAYAEFDVDRVATFGAEDIERLLADPGIIRNRRKIDAAAENARRIQALRMSHGSFSDWLEAHHPRSLEAWTRLFRRTFRFTGGQIVGEFLISLGFLSGAHEPDCPVCPGSRIIATLGPGWGAGSDRVDETGLTPIGAAW
jgi:DNA-3-methyladenine glycosylase I